LGIDLGYCEVCGLPATNGVRDVYVWTDWDFMSMKYKPEGEWRLFCNFHNRESEAIDISVSPLAYHKDMYAKL
jgi:ferredoxin